MSTIVTETKAKLPLWKDGKNGSSLQFLRSFTRLEKEEPQTHRLIKNHIEEGFECEDSEYKYHIGKSQYGMWLSRKKKPIFIPDPPTTITTAKMTAVEDKDNGNTNNNDDDDMKLEPRSAAFVSNQPSRISQQQEQEQEQQQQPLEQLQQQQPAVVYPYSVKIEQAANGSAKVSIHTYNDDPDKARYESIRLFIQTREELKSKGIKVLEA